MSNPDAHAEATEAELRPVLGVSSVERSVET
jgi:hypothetical protein